MEPAKIRKTNNWGVTLVYWLGHGRPALGEQKSLLPQKPEGKSIFRGFG
jgi:hypothetical protein